MSSDVEVIRKKLTQNIELKAFTVNASKIPFIQIHDLYGEPTNLRIDEETLDDLIKFLQRAKTLYKE